MMSPIEKVLTSLRTQVRFEIAQIGAEWALAATTCSQLRRRVTDLKVRCSSTAEELRAEVRRPLIDLALLGAMRRLYRLERRELKDVTTRLNAARDLEVQTRNTLTGLRNRERSLERALEAERRKSAFKQRTRELVEADEFWLQSPWRESAL
jgi:hypothetical protein